MKKILNYTLIFTPAILGLLIIGGFLINVEYDNVIEIRKTWFSLVLYTLIAILFSILFITLTLKSFLSKNGKWIKYTLGSFYFLILSFCIYLLIEKQQGTLLFIVLIFSSLIISLLFLVRKEKLKFILFVIHSIIFSLISIGFVIGFITDNHKDRVVEDKAVIYKMAGKNQKVIVQGEGVWQKEYLISRDFGLFRKRTKFEGSLPDGNWQVFGKDSAIIANFTIKDGTEINRDNLISSDKIIVNSIRDIKNNLQKTGITFLFSGDYSLNEPIEIINGNDLRFESIPGKDKASIRANGKPCFIITGSSRISINDFDLLSVESDAVIKINDSKEISIIDSKISCQKSSEFGILVDETSDDITLDNNEFHNPIQYSIVGYSNSTFINGNRFYLSDRYSNYKSILLKDKQFESTTVVSLIKKIILNYDERNLENNSNSAINLFGKRYFNFKGNLNDLLYTYNFYNELNEFMENEYCSNCECSSPYCANLLELLSGDKLYLSYPKSGDSWCFDDNSNPKFKFINPSFFSWASKKLELQPDSLIQGVSYSFIYQSLFSNLIRDYYIAYKKLKNSKNSPELINAYKVFVDSADTYSNLDLFLYHELKTSSALNANEYYYKEQGDNLGEFYQDSKVSLYKTLVNTVDSDDIIAKDYLKIMSFWIRREIDGSAKSINDAILYYLKRYDKDWLAKHS